MGSNSNNIDGKRDIAEVPDFPMLASAITTSDATTYSPPVTVYVGVGGDVAIVPALGSAAVTFKNVPAGSVVPCRASKVMATNTTATNLVGLS